MKKKKWLCYILAGFLIFVICGIYLFPSDDIKRYISLRFSEALPGYYIAVKKVQPAFPPGLKLQQIDFFDQQGVLFSADRILLRPRFFSLLTDTPEFSFDGDAFQGTLNGKLSLKRGAAASILSIESQIQDFQLSDILSDMDIKGYQFAGLLEGELHGTLNSKSGAELAATLFVNQGTVDMASSVLGLQRIKFNRITSDLEMHNHYLTIKRCEIDSYQAQTNFTGKITLMNPLGESRIRIKGALQIIGTDNNASNTDRSLLATSLGNMNYRISGSFNQPVFALQ